MFHENIIVKYEIPVKFVYFVQLDKFDAKFICNLDCQIVYYENIIMVEYEISVKFV